MKKRGGTESNFNWANACQFTLAHDVIIFIFPPSLFLLLPSTTLSVFTYFLDSQKNREIDQTSSAFRQ